MPKTNTNTWRDFEADPPAQDGAYLGWLEEPLAQASVATIVVARGSLRIVGGHFYHDAPRVTHWMPLPPPPGQENLAAELEAVAMRLGVGYHVMGDQPDTLVITTSATQECQLDPVMAHLAEQVPGAHLERRGAVLAIVIPMRAIKPKDPS